MKKITILPMIAIVFFELLLTGCQHDDVFSHTSTLAISDPEIKKEIEFMREKNLIDEKLYQQWQTAKRSDVLDEWDVLIDEKGTVRHDEAYDITPPMEDDYVQGDLSLIDGTLINRTIIQDLMKESALSA